MTYLTDEQRNIPKKWKESLQRFANSKRAKEANNPPPLVNDGNIT